MDTIIADPAAAVAPDVARYLERKRHEIALLDACLATSLALPVPRSVAEVIDYKFKLAAAMRAERSLASWAVTETARPEMDEWRCGAFVLRYGYQRADLEIHGPAIHPSIEVDGYAAETLYTGSGMSAIASLFTALAHLRGTLDVRVAREGYGETRELFERFGERIRVSPWKRRRPANDTGECIVLVDSAGRAIPHRDDPMPRGASLVVFDTTCFGRTSGRVRRVVTWARRHDVPLALVRSHAKLDALGIEYGRLGSILLTWRRNAPLHLRALVRETRDCVRLLGSAAIPAHLAPFVGTPAYDIASAARTTAIIRNTRRLARRLRETPLASSVEVRPHGLFLTIAPRGELRVQDVKRAVASLCAALSAQGLAVRHAGSFGFDFVAMEWFPHPVTHRNVIRVAPGDLPISAMDTLAQAIARWFSLQVPGRGQLP